MLDRAAVVKKFPLFPWVAPPILVVIALACQYAGRSLTQGLPFLLVYPAVAIGSLVGNRVSTLLGTVIGALGAWLWLFPEPAAAQAYFGLTVFVLSGVSISFLSDLMFRGLENRIQAQSGAHEEFVDTLDSMSDAFFALDKNWKIIQVNSHHEKTTKTFRKDQIGKDLREVFFSDPVYQESAYLKSYTKAMNERVFVRFEDYYEPLELWTEVRVYPKADGGLAVFFTDIGERVKNEQRLAIERKKLEAIFYGSDFPMVLFRGPDLVYEMANQKYLELISFRDVLGKKLADALPEIASSVFPLKISEVYATGEPVRFLEGQTPILDPKSGKLENRYFDTTFARISEGHGRDFLVVGNAMDVTERVVQRQQIEESAQKLRLESHKLETLFQEAPAAMALWRGPDFIFEKVNPRYQALFPDRDLLGKPFLEACPEFAGLPFFGYLKRVFATGEPYIGNEEYAPLRLTKDGPLEDRYFDFTYLRIKDAEGNPYGVYDHAIDVTEKVKARKQIEASRREADAARAEAERANELKSAFLANMSHEIRTPLGAMVGFADLLRDPSLSRDEHSNYIGILTRNGEQLATIINDILDLSKVEAGHLTLEYQQTSAELIAADVVSLMQVKAQEKDIELGFRVDPSTPAQIVTDPLRLRQILLNIVGNAVKFTQAGSVHVRSFGTSDPQVGTTLFFAVTDTGIGIPKQERERIFEAFVQADGTLARRFGGTGLGLALSRELARNLRGDVVVTESVEGHGSTFLISVEDQPSMTTHSSERVAVSDVNEPKTGSLKGLKILVVDDAPDNRQLISRFLGKYGAVIDLAENGLIGFKKALAGNFDVVLMDIQMPEMDGYTATQKLREAGYRKPIIALTAHAMTEVRKKCLYVGYTDHLTKPIKSKELVALVARFAP